MGWLKQHKNDILLTAVLLVLGIGLALFLLITRQDGGVAVVQVDGKTVMELSLRQDVWIVLGEGEHTNTLVIENRRARVVEATCPDQICVNQWPVQYEGESIVCLPHKLVVTIQGGAGNGVDGATK